MLVNVYIFHPQLVVNCGIIPRLVSFVVMGDSSLQVKRSCVLTVCVFLYHVIKESALRTIGNIVTSREKHVRMIIDSGVLSHFALLLTHQNTNIQKVL